MLGAQERWLLNRLKLTLAPRKSKPGSIEALIDDLTDYWDDSSDPDDETGQTAYWQLVERGLEAIPALMEHLNDPRLTRTRGTHPVKGFRIDYQVGTLAKFIVNTFSDGQMSAEDSKPLNEWVELPKHKWWAEARKVGEEKWALDNVLPKDREQEQVSNEILLRLIRVKYPARLKDVYRTLLQKFPDVYSGKVVTAIVKSKIAREQKVALLEEGARHKGYWHRHEAIEALARVDDAVFRKRILTGLENLPAGMELRFSDPDARSESIDLIYKTDDAKCWAALKAATLRMPIEERLYIVRVAGSPGYEGESDPARRERLRFLLWSLSDEVVQGLTPDNAREVHNIATLRLANNFELIGHKSTPWDNKLPQSPRELSLLRNRARDLAEREMARPAK